MYKVLIVPSSDDEGIFENATSYEEAIKLKSKAHAYEWSFNTKEKRKIFIEGYEAGVGYLGNGLYFTNN